MMLFKIVYLDEIADGRFPDYIAKNNFEYQELTESTTYYRLANRRHLNRILKLKYKGKEVLEATEVKDIKND